MRKFRIVLVLQEYSGGCWNNETHQTLLETTDVIKATSWLDAVYDFFESLMKFSRAMR